MQNILAALLAFLLSGSIAQASTLYALSPPNIYTINPETGFAWPIYGLSSLTTQSIDLASDWRAPSPRVWATDATGDDQLMLVNAEKGTGSIVGSYGFGVAGPTMRAIAFDVVHGKLYGVARPASISSAVHAFYEINPTTAAVTLIGSTGYPQITAMGTDLDGTIYAAATTATGSDLITIDAATGAGTFVASMGVAVADLAVRPEDGQMFAVAGLVSTLYKVDKASGVLQPVGEIAANTVHGLAFLPEPSCAAVLATGCLLLRRRR